MNFFEIECASEIAVVTQTRNAELVSQTANLAGMRRRDAKETAKQTGGTAVRQGWRNWVVKY